MFLLEQFAPAVIIAAFVVLGAASITRWLRHDWIRQFASAVAVGAGYASGHVKSTGWPAFPPVDVTHWLLFSAIAAVLIGLLFGIARGSVQFLGLLSIGVLLMATVGLLMTPKFRFGWTGLEGSTWVVALVASGCIFACAIDSAIRSPQGRLSLLWLLVIAAGMSVALAFSGSLLLAQLAAVYSAVVFGLVVVSSSGVTLHRAVVPGLATLFVGLLACGHLYAELPQICAGLLALTPILVLVVRNSPTPLRRDVIRASIALVSAAAIVLLARQASPPIDYY